jgi:beta-mannosidase
MSWSSIEWNCTWKLLHYAAQNFFAPVLVSMFEEDNQVKVWITSDLNRHIKGSLSLQIVSFRDGSIEKDWNLNIDIDPNDSKCLYTIDIADIFGKQLHYYDYIKDSNLARTKTFLTARFNPEDNSVYQGKPISNLMFFVPLKNVSLQKATLETKWITQEGNEWELEISSDTVAPFVWLRLLTDCKPERPWCMPLCAGRFSDNGFLMLGNEKRRVKFYKFGKKPLSSYRLETFSLCDSF